MVLQLSTRYLLVLWAEVRPPGPLLEESRWLDQLTHQQSQDFSSSRQNPHHQWPCGFVGRLKEIDLGRFANKFTRTSLTEGHTIARSALSTVETKSAGHSKNLKRIRHRLHARIKHHT